MEFRTAIGQDSHRFEEAGSEKPLVLGGVIIPGATGFSANSDGDVLLHALCNAVSGITGVNILGKPADGMCRSGITDSSAYLKEALRFLPEGAGVCNVSFTVEAARPKLAAHIPAIKENVAALLGITPDRVGLTATTGEGLTAFGQGLGMMVFCVITVKFE